MTDGTRGLGPISISGASNGMTASKFAPAEATRAVLADHERKYNDLSNYTQSEVNKLYEITLGNAATIRALHVWVSGLSLLIVADTASLIWQAVAR